MRAFILCIAWCHSQFRYYQERDHCVCQVSYLTNTNDVTQKWPSPLGQWRGHWDLKLMPVLVILREVILLSALSQHLMSNKLTTRALVLITIYCISDIIVLCISKLLIFEIEVNLFKVQSLYLLCFWTRSSSLLTKVLKRGARVVGKAKQPFLTCGEL